MQILLLKNTEGGKALMVNGAFILDGDNTDDSGALVETVAERLAVATKIGLNVREFTPGPAAGWTWESVAAMSGAPITTCEKCGSKLHSDGLCPDLTCPYSDWPQCVSLDDMHALDADALCAKYGLIRAEAHSDDRVIEATFEAHAWFIGASVEDILALAAEEWGTCEVADGVALHHETGPRLTLLFDYIHSKNAIQRDVGFECNVNSDDAMAWLRHQRPGVWAQILCSGAGVHFSQAEEDEIRGMWDWIGPHGDACDRSFECLDEAALDAVQRLGLGDCSALTPLYFAYWSVEAFLSPDGQDVRQIVGPALFCDALGYDADDISVIAALGIGQSWMSADYGPAHTVRRLG